MSMDSRTTENSSKETTLDSTSSTVPVVNYKRRIEARDSLIRGVNAVNDAVAPTIGPDGRDALLGAFEWPYSVATNDGASIAEKVKCEDPYENMGANLMKEAIGRANKESGDGSTTTCILTAAVLKEGSKYADITTVDFKKELNAVLPTVLKGIDKQTRKVEPEDLWKVATTSAQDEEMGKLIGEIYNKIGKEGVISWEPSPREGTEYEIKDGVELCCGHNYCCIRLFVIGETKKIFTNNNRQLFCGLLQENQGGNTVSTLPIHCSSSHPVFFVPN